MDRFLHAPSCVYTALCVWVTALPVENQATPCYGPLRSKREPAPAPPGNNKTPAVATDRLLRAPPCLWSTNQSPATTRFARRGGQPPQPPLNNKTPAWPETVFCVLHLVCAPPCVCAALLVERPPTPCYGSLRSTRWPQTGFCVLRLVCAPPCLWSTNQSPATARLAQRRGQPPQPPEMTRLLWWSQTAFCVLRLLRAPPCLWSTNQSLATARFARRRGQPPQPP